eukprot:376796_1
MLLLVQCALQSKQSDHSNNFCGLVRTPHIFGRIDFGTAFIDTMRTLIVGKDAIAVMFHVSVLCLNPISFVLVEIEQMKPTKYVFAKVFKLNLTSLVKKKK